MKNTRNIGDELLQRLAKRVIGQDKALRAIVPYIETQLAGLNPEGRPVGVFLLLGPTGTGKTRTVEALAEALHGSPKHVLRIDCGEFHLEHEVAKLVGAPPGYLGHRETHPLLTQARIASVASRHSDVSIILFDEVEKAAPSLTRLLLGVLDKATIRLGDNTSVNLERCLIFMTSNLGASGMMKALSPGIGFAGPSTEPGDEYQRLEHVAMTAARRHFSPEFMNRIDVAVTYQPLSERTLSAILDLQLTELQDHIERRLGERAFTLQVGKESRKFLLEEGVSAQYGAREMRRTVQRHVIQPLSSFVVSGRAAPGGVVRAEFSRRARSLVMKAA